MNGLRYERLLLSAKKYGDKLQTLRDNLVLEIGKNSAATYKTISDNMIAIFDAYEYHLISSSSAGAISPIMLGIMAKGKPPTEDHHAQLAAILAGATDVESADITAGTDRILDKLEKIPSALNAFANEDREEAARWLRSAESNEAGEEFADYLKRHGHRAVRELDLRQKEWAADPSPLIASLQSGLRARLSNTTRHQATDREEPQIENKILKRMIPFAHSSVRARERTKSSLVAVTTTFKRAYRSLAVQMVNEGWLPDDDAIFFLSHSEIGELLSGNTQLKEVIEPRRRALQFQKDLRFEEVFQGKPA